MTPHPPLRGTFPPRGRLCGTAGTPAPTKTKERPDEGIRPYARRQTMKEQLFVIIIQLGVIIGLMAGQIFGRG